MIIDFNKQYTLTDFENCFICKRHIGSAFVAGAGGIGFSDDRPYFWRCFSCDYEVILSININTPQIATIVTITFGQQPNPGHIIFYDRNYGEIWIDGKYDGRKANLPVIDGKLDLDEVIDLINNHLDTYKLLA